METAFLDEFSLMERIKKMWNFVFHGVTKPHPKCFFYGIASLRSKLELLFPYDSVPCCSVQHDSVF